MSNTSSRPPILLSIALPFLVLLSGFCGISYEIIYTKLLGNLLGNRFTINATVLLTFLLGIGLGTLVAHRFVRFLWAIEAGVGAYAVAMAASYGWLNHLVYSRLPAVGTNILTCALVSFLLLLVPAFLIGCTIPLFASYLACLRRSGVFSFTYGIYNIGAAITALAMEFVLLRSIGLRAATVALASLNGVVALSVLAMTRSGSLSPAFPTERVRFAGSTLAALAIASMASAVFQLLMIKLGEFILGPYNETFSLVLAVVLLGLALGSAAAGRFGLTFRGALMLCLGGIAWVVGFLSSVVTVYAELYPAASQSYPLLVLLKFGLVFVLVGPAAIGYGATIPALLKTYGDIARESGQLLFCSSMANALGFLLMAFFLHGRLDYGPLLVLISGMTAGALVVHGARTPRRVVATVGMVAIAVAAYRVSWNELILYVGHTNFHSVTELEEERQRRLSADRFKGPQDVFAITWKDGKPYFFINGYISIPLASKSEKLLGVLAPMLSPRLDDALVLGVGTGATAGTVGLIFDRADVVEINRAVLGNLHRMEEYNFGIEHQPGVNIIHDDGIHFVKTSPKKYSLILNTVTTPLYFSSSKLYTVDFFEAVMERLRPDGVYVTWMDQRIGDRGAEIILETLAHVFRECWLNYMNYNYFILACSDADIGLAQFDAVVGHRKLSRYFSQRHSLPLRLLPYGVISLDALEFRSPEGAPLNTLDFPVLEHEMARLQTGASLRKFKDRLKQQMDLEELQAALAPWMEWKPAEFLLHSDLRIKTTSTLARTLRYKTRQQFGDLDTAYDEAALALAAEVGTPRAYYNYGKRLQGRNRDDAAITALLRVVELDPSFNNAHYYLGRTYYSQGAYEKALTHFVSEWKRDRDRDVPMWVGRTLVKLSRYEEALEWVKRARASGVRIDDATMDYYRRLARQGRTNGLHGTSVKNGQRKGGGS